MTGETDVGHNVGTMWASKSLWSTSGELQLSAWAFWIVQRAPPLPQWNNVLRRKSALNISSYLPSPEGAAGEYSSPSGVNFLCWLLLRCPFQRRVTAVARNERSGSFCQKCWRQVTAKHAFTLGMWLCMKWRDMAHGCMVYTERAETAAVSRGTSHVTTKQRCTENISMNIQKHAIKS